MILSYFTHAACMFIGYFAAVFCIRTKANDRDNNNWRG